MKKIVRLAFVFFLLSGFSMQETFGQCAAPISAFPYFENFELSIGGWTTGGTNSDWTYGTPNKAVITTALSAACKMWISSRRISGASAQRPRCETALTCTSFDRLPGEEI